jgi:hypothetical protein
MKARSVFVLALVPLTLSSCNQQGPGQPPPVTPAAAQVGPPQSCIQLAQIQSTKVRDDWTIDFLSGGTRAWRNTLPNRCSGLKMADAFTYKTSLSQLCNTDIVYVLETAGGLHRGAGCGLGQFVPVRLQR